MEFPWNDMYLKEIQLYMSRAYGPGSYDASYEKQGRDYPLPYVRWTENRNMEEFLRLVATGRIDVRPLITHEFRAGRRGEGLRHDLRSGGREPGRAAALSGRSGGRSGGGIYAGQQGGDTAVRAAPRSASNSRWSGAGNLAKWEHLPNIKKLPGVGLRAVYSAAGVRGKSYALRFGAAYACSEYEEVLRDAEVDAVLIASRNQHHAAQSLAALRAGKHVFVEKPMALTAEECSRALRRGGRERQAADGGLQPALRAFLSRPQGESGAAQLAGGGAMPHQFAGDFGKLLDGRPGDRRRDSG